MAIPARAKWVATVAVVVVAWWAAAFAYADHDLGDRIGDLVARETADQARTTVGMAYSIAASLRHLRGIPPAVAGEPAVVAAVASFGAAVPVSAGPATLRRAQWEARTDLWAVDRRLSDLAAALGVDIIWVVDAAGDCIAASNAGHDASFVGTNYGDREYFTAIHDGLLGRQFAVGRQTNVPGLYFSAPVIRDGVVLGGVVVKVDLPHLSHWVEQGNTIVTDEYGVVIAASDPALRFTALPGGTWTTRSPAFLDARYKRTQFTTTDIKPFRVPGLVTVADAPVPSLLTSHALAQDGIAVHLLSPIAEFDQAVAGNRHLLWSLLAVGSLALLLVTGGAAFLADTRRNVRLLEEKNVVLSRLSVAADAANAAKSRFLATMSHELRTPFSGILGMVELLQAADLPGEAPQQLRLLERSARMLLGLLNDILDFS